MAIAALAAIIVHLAQSAIGHCIMHTAGELVEDFLVIQHEHPEAVDLLMQCSDTVGLLEIGAGCQDNHVGRLHAMNVLVGNSAHQLELTWMRDMDRPYNLGDNEFHLAFRVDDYEAAHARHEKMGCICYENAKMGIYFVTDPDGYWLEVLPTR